MDWLAFAAVLGPVVAFVVGMLTQARGLRADRASAAASETANLFESWADITERLTEEIERLTAEVDTLRRRVQDLSEENKDLTETIQSLHRELSRRDRR